MRNAKFNEKYRQKKNATKASANKIRICISAVLTVEGNIEKENGI